MSFDDTPAVEPLVSFDSAWTIIGRTHWDTTYNGVNWRGIRDELRPKAAAAQTTGEVRAILADMVGRLGQSHFSIIPRESADGVLSPADRRDQNGTVGLHVRFIDDQIVVFAVDSGGPAAQGGVGHGWLLESIGGCPLAPRLASIPRTQDSRRVSLSAFRYVTRALEGPVGDSVLLRFRDAANAAHDVTLVRTTAPGVMAKFGNLPALAASLDWERLERGGRTIGVIRFNIWMPVLAPLFDAAIDSLRESDAIVLDLRGNFGGVGGMSMGFAGHFLDSTYTIGTMHQRGMTTKFVANPRRTDTRSRRVTPYAGPLALVVDELSISTTEIFAEGLRAINRAQVFGVQSAGQALPSVPERLPNGDILYHAIADFTSPTGRQVEGDGVRPSVVTPLTRGALLAGQDPALDAAVAWAVRSSTLPRQ